MDDTTGEVDTYTDLLRCCIRTARAFEASKVDATDPVLVHIHNDINTVVPLIASYFIGALPSCIDFNLSLTDTVEFLKKIQPLIIFTDSSGGSKLNKAVMEHGADVPIVDFAHFDVFISDFTPDEISGMLTSENRIKLSLTV
uniref:AMP-dependent synthetase/ligase domain-containing protein n=1 Tax=Photinus pyralis TaxID=7054 RepID=A0A1Y1N4Y6_PHOPY